MSYNRDINIERMVGEGREGWGCTLYDLTKTLLQANVSGLRVVSDGLGARIIFVHVLGGRTRVVVLAGM